MNSQMETAKLKMDKITKNWTNVSDSIQID
jgi:hypothetical protein